jgi:hypothetical protein
MGSGDLRGFNIGFGFQKQLFKHFAVETNLRGISASETYYFNLLSSANPKTTANSELRFNTSGFQLEFLPVFPIVNRLVKISLLGGLVLKRQNNSMPTSFGKDFTVVQNGLSVYYQRSFIENTLGFSGQIEASMKLGKKSYLGGRLVGDYNRNDLNWHFPLVFMREI